MNILLTKNKDIKGHTININNIVIVFDKAEIHNGLFISLSFEGSPRVSIFGDKMRAVLKELDKNNIKVKLA
jgi:hypothetical protein